MLYSPSISGIRPPNQTPAPRRRSAEWRQSAHAGQPTAATPDELVPTAHASSDVTRGSQALASENSAIRSLCR